MYLSLLGNLSAVSMVGTAVWMGMQWRPSPHEDGMMMLAIALAFSGGLLTAISSQVSSEVEEEEETMTRPPTRSGVSPS
jgi:hypothetical protein